MIERIRQIFEKKDNIFTHPKASARLEKEVEQCFDYFEKQKIHKSRERVIEIHGSGIVLKRVTNQNGYVLEIDNQTDKQNSRAYKEIIKLRDEKVFKSKISYMNGSIIPLNQKYMDKEEFEDIILKIHNITFPYFQHIKNMEKHKKT